MKKQLLVISILLACLSTSAQNFFAQKKTKLKYIAQQIAAFQVYAGYVQKGYTIAEEGWGLIDDIKNSDFDLHNNYFNSLKTVNTSIAGYDKIDETKSVKENIESVSDGISSFIKDNDYIQEQEKQYISNVINHLLQTCEDATGELAIITSNGNVEMKDDERINRINAIHQDMQDKYAFVKHFERTVKLLSLSRERDADDAADIKLLNDIK